MELFYSDTFELPLPAGHRFPMAKYTLLRNRIEQELVGENGCQLLLPPAATDQQILLAHTPEYLSAIKSGELTAVQQRRIGFPWSEKMVERSRRSTGASIAASRSAMKNGVSVNLAGGTHHAFAGSGQGYCVFNDVCVGGRVLQQSGLAEKVLVIDLDVHQGNGTSGIVKNDRSMFSFSIHCEKNFPFKKTAGDLDIALPAGTGDEVYLNQLRLGLGKIHQSFEADFVFYLAGADPFEGDRLGLLNLTKPGLAERDKIVFEFCQRRDIPIAVAMAGGYAPGICDIVDIHFSTVETALQFSAAR